MSVNQYIEMDRRHQEEIAALHRRSKDADLLHQTLERHKAELAAAIAEDKTGDGFIYLMFLERLCYYEYEWTGNIKEALDDLGYTMEQIEADARLLHGFQKACKVLTDSATRLRQMYPEYIGEFI